MVEATLRALNTWYLEPTEGGDRPKLLSKLAALELCGWIEGEFDRLVMKVEDARLGDEKWVIENVLARTFGFKYNDHFRPMLCKLIGEIFVRRIEAKLEVDFPGELDRFKSILSVLWNSRCSFAHADVAANVAAQQTFNAPSWAINQHRIIKKSIERYETSMLSVIGGI